MDVRKPVAVISVVLMAIAWYFAVQYKNETNVIPASGTSLGQYRVELITMDKTDEHWDYVNRGASDMARFAGIQYQWEAPQNKNVEQQIELINNAVANGVDLIMIAATDRGAVGTALEEAKAHGVKIIYVDSPANVEALVTLATDNYRAGQIAGRSMLEEIQEHGINKGVIGIIGVDKETNSTMDREKGFRDIINKDGRFSLLPTVYMEGEIEASKIAATDFITQNNDLAGIFGTNEGSTTGVGAAIQSSGKSIIGIGFDRSDAIIEFLNSGDLKAVMVQNPYTMGYLGMAEAIAALKGDSLGPNFINTGVAILRKR